MNQMNRREKEQPPDGVLPTEISHRWLALRTAAALIDVSERMILDWAVLWQDLPVPSRIRFKLLTFGVGQPQERRFFSRDLDDGHLRVRPSMGRLSAAGISGLI